MTYKIAKFHKCLIYFHVKFEPDCLKIDGVMVILLGKRILAFFLNRPVSSFIFCTLYRIKGFKLDYSILGVVKFNRWRGGGIIELYYNPYILNNPEYLCIWYSANCKRKKEIIPCIFFSQWYLDIHMSG